MYMYIFKCDRHVARSVNSAMRRVDTPHTRTRNFRLQKKTHSQKEKNIAMSVDSAMRRVDTPYTRTRNFRLKKKTHSRKICTYVHSNATGT